MISSHARMIRKCSKHLVHITCNPRRFLSASPIEQSLQSSQGVTVRSAPPTHPTPGNLPYKSENQTTDYSQIPTKLEPKVMERIEAKILSGCSESFFICNLEHLHTRHKLWQDYLPQVRPFYAVKCNDDQRVLEVLASLGCGFDCASLKEINDVKDLVNDPTSDIIFANPCKQQSHITHARENGVQLMTFDNVDELYKIKSLFPEAACVLRLATDDADAVCQLSCKFGAQIGEIDPLLATAKSIGINVVGVSFHCGSGNQNKAVYKDAMDRASLAFESSAKHGFTFNLLDIGGGFPGHGDEDHIFVDIANAITPSFNNFDKNVKIISEPGRFYAASIQTLITRIFSFKEHKDESFTYYINDGVYGSFNSILYDHANPIPRRFNPTAQSNETEEKFPSTIYGPTCDGLDCVHKNTMMPRMGRDDWIYFENMGAYTNVGGSEFNGMPRPGFEYIDK